jgi:four helix bundle protein
MTKPEELRERTKQFALRIIKLFRELPRTEEARVIGRQLLRSGTSVAANHRAACRSRSKAEFTAKMGIVVEEADESVFWIELLVDAHIVRHEQIASILAETNELLAIFAASHRTARSSNLSIHE